MTMYTPDLLAQVRAEIAALKEREAQLLEELKAEGGRIRGEILKSNIASAAEAADGIRRLVCQERFTERGHRSLRAVDIGEHFRVLNAMLDRVAEHADLIQQLLDPDRQ